MNNILMRVTFTVAILLVAFTSLANACTTPVWRYALERWWPDPYRVEITTNANPTVIQQRAMDMLETAWENEDLPANVVVTATNAAEGKTASIKVRYPSLRGMPNEKQPAPFWESSLTLDAARRILYSQFRQDMAARIATGEEIVFVLLESGSVEADKTAMDKLSKILPQQNESFKQYRRKENRIATNQWAGAYTLPPLEFTQMSLERGNPQESFFVESLLQSQPGLESIKEPIVFAVFGKGRCLPALAGAEITRENILMYCDFMSGACSCQVKHQNPGFDLLLSINWKEAFFHNEEYVEDVQPVLTSVMAVPTEEEETNRPPQTATNKPSGHEALHHAAQTESGDMDLILVTIAAFAVLLLVAVVGTVFLAKKGK